MTRQFAVLPPSKAVWVTMLLLGGLVPLTILAMVLVLSDEMRAVQTIVPHAISIVAVLAILSALVAVLRRMRVETEDGMLVVRAALYTRKLPFESVDIERARILDLDRSSEYWPRVRLNGIALPGLHIGYYRGTPIKRKLFCLITSSRRVLLLPEREPEHFLLLSLERPQALIDALKQKQR